MAKKITTKTAAYRQFLSEYGKRIAAISDLENVMASTVESNETAVRKSIKLMREAEAAFPQQATADPNFQSVFRDLFKMKDELTALKKTGRGLCRNIKITGSVLFGNPVDWAFILKSIRIQQKILIEMNKETSQLSRERHALIGRLTGLMRQMKRRRTKRKASDG